MMETSSNVGEDIEELSKMLKALKKEQDAKKVSAESAESVEKEAALVLKSLYRPTSVVTRICKKCKSHFQTDYAYKFYCTRKCLKDALEEIGLYWDPDKTENERWGGEPPSNIYPETLKILKRWAKAILDYDPEESRMPPSKEPVQELVQEPVQEGKPTRQERLDRLRAMLNE